MNQSIQESTLDLSDIRSIYFIGIGGIAMSATAGLAKQQGFEVSGADSGEVYSPSKEVLDKYDIEYYLGYDASHVSNNPADLYVISAGVNQHNPEVEAVLANNLPYKTFAELLYLLSKEQIRIVVAGTHGKSTTSSMLGESLRNIDDSSYLVGAVLKQTESNFYQGQGHYIVFEGDEYRAGFDEPAPKFHFYHPDILVLTNLEFDHPDVYTSLEEMQGEFTHLVENLPDDGIIIYNADDIALDQILYQSNRRKFSFSQHAPSDVKLVSVKTEETGTFFKVQNAINPESIREEVYTINLPGRINILNALATITCLRALGFQAELVEEGLKKFQGIKRRFEILGSSQGITIIDDYAHHPTAVRETIAIAKLHYPNRQIWAVFEPHTFSRTQATLKDLALSFNQADQVLLAPIYAARENGKNFSITTEQVLSAIQKNQPQTRLVKDKADALKILQTEAQQGDIIIVMAVGSFNHLGYELLSSLN